MPAALVTGGGRRIGAAIVRALHAAGINVVIHHRASDGEAAALATALNAQRANSAVALAADLLLPDQVEQLARQAVRAWGGLDLLVNSASTYYETPLGAITSDAFDDLIGTNLKAPLFLAQACAPALRAAGGSIINISDIYASKPLKLRAAYCAAKAGLEAVTQVLALELAPQVRVNAIAPGAMLEPIDGSGGAGWREAMAARIPAGRLGGAQAIADAVLYLAGPRAAFVTGMVLKVDGGEALL
jgi:pteridine reductase